MNDEQVNNLATKLDDARASFDQATNKIKWNRINTIIQYCLILVVVFMLVSGFIYYKNDQRESCERSNDFRMTVSVGMEKNALNIGLALAAVLGGSEEDVDAYLAAYNDLPKPPELVLREC